jgi:DNA-binding transcriptional ArsR family regulator
MVTNQRARLVFPAIADPTRRKIVDMLRGGEMRAGEIAVRFEVSRPAIAKHVRILKQAGLLKERREATARIYRLEPAGLAEIDNWIAPYRLFWAARLTNLKTVIETEEAKSNDRNRP